MKKFLIFLLFLIPILLCIIWFHSGLLIGSGESALPFYNTIKELNLSRHAWSDGPLGIFTSISIPSLITYSVIAFFQQFLSFWSTQVIFFFLLLSSMLFGTFFLSWKVFRFSLKTSFIVAAFYLLNLVSFSLIWNRLQYPFIFFYAFLPIGFLCFLQGIKEKKYIYSLLFAIATLVYSFGFVSLPTLELWWFLIGGYLIFYTFVVFHDKKSLYFAWKFFFSSLFFFLIFHAWWILQFIYTFTHTSYISQTAYTQSGDASVLTSISERLGNLSYIFRMMHRDFFIGDESTWRNFYTNIAVTCVSFIVPFLAFFPLLLKKKPSIIYFFVAMALLTTFLMKGSAGPFGFITVFLFNHLRFLEAFRNSFEKFGLGLPFAYAPLIGFSFFYIYQEMRKKYGSIKSSIFFSLIGILVFVILVLPLWNGSVFTNNDIRESDYVAVPGYYEQANAWLNLQGTMFRTIVLPMSGEGITYKWDYGYTGVELSNTLFDVPAISLQTNVPYLINITSQLEPTLQNAPDKFSILMKFLDAKYIIVRSDIDYVYRGMTNPQDISSMLVKSPNNDLQNIQYEKTFGKLQFYMLTKPLSKIYVPESLIFASSDTPFIDVFNETSITDKNAIANTTITDKQNTFLQNNSKEILLSPTSVLDYSNYPHLTIDDAKQQLSYPHFLPGSPFYYLIRLREYWEDKLTADNQLFKKITLTSKRLSELNYLLARQKTSFTQEAVENYVESLTSLQNVIDGGEYGTMQNNLYYFRQIYIGQRLILLDMAKQYPEEKGVLQKALDKLKSFSLVNGVYPLSDPLESSLSSNRTVYLFNITKTGDYTLLIKNDNSRNLTELNDKNPLQIDNRIVETNIVRQDNWLNLGNFSFQKGEHEIQLLYDNKNILEDNKETTIKTNNTENASKAFKFTIDGSQQTYTVSFDYWIRAGQMATIDFISDVDSRTGNNVNPFWHTGLVEDGYTHTYKNVSFTFTPPANAKTVAIKFNVSPYNTYSNCEGNNSPNIIKKYQCKYDKSFYATFGKASIITIKNLRVKNVSPRTLYLQMEQSNISPTNVPTISVKRINPSYYTVHVDHATQPFFLVFSETFHSLWKVEYTDTKMNIPEDKHFLANSYANMWYIERKGSYDITINFAAEKVFTIGKIISITAFILTLLSFIAVAVYKHKKKLWK